MRVPARHALPLRTPGVQVMELLGMPSTGGESPGLLRRLRRVAADASAQMSSGLSPVRLARRLLTSLPLAAYCASTVADALYTDTFR